MFAVSEKYQDVFCKENSTELPVAAKCLQLVIGYINNLSYNNISIQAIYLHSIPTAEKFYLNNGFLYIPSSATPLFSVDKGNKEMWLPIRKVLLENDDEKTDVKSEIISPLVLWNSREDENNIVWKNDDDSEYPYLDFSGFYTKGIQLFDYKDRNNSLGITSPLWEASNLPFCFSDDIVYFVKDDYFIVGYKKDGTSFKEVFTKNILTLYNQIQESFNSSYLSIKSITYCDQYLYFYFDALDENPYLGRLHLDENDENALSYTDFDSEPNITAMGIYKNESELNLIYISYENDNDNESSECIKTPIKVDTEFSLDQDNSVSLYTMSSDYFTVRKISDLQIIGDTCYLLFAEYSRYIGGIPIAYYSLNDARILLCTCTGGVVKIDLQTNSVGKWKNGSKILGEYKFNGSFYEPNENWGYDEKNNSSITAMPPLEQANNYFYGPVKFIAKKPDALVIADDGIYIDAEIDEYAFISKLKKFKNMNRVVTLDLKNELMSAVDVNVTFNVSVDQDSSSFYIEDEIN